MKKTQKLTQNEGNHMSLNKSQNDISLTNGPLKEVLVENSNKIKSFSATKRSEIEWLRLGQQQAIAVDFIDRKLFDRKDDKLLLFKNINIPSIKIKDTSFQCQKAHFLSVRRLESEDKYRNIELKSKTLSFVFDQHGDCQIQHVRFKETSFHHHGDSFQLVIALTNFDNQLVSTFISSPFLVESRKKPFQERAHKEQNISTLYDPFLPSILEKQYNLGGSQIDSSDKSKIIGDDLQSLIIYFSAQNIRHKIIHPLYLLFKFPKAISLFYNKNIIKQETISPENLIIQIQRYIFEKLLNTNQNDSIEDESEQRLLILCLKSNNYSININKDLAKVSKYMSFLEGPTLTFLEKTPSDLPSEFKLIENIDEMKAAYSRVYCEISQIKIEIKMNQDKLENQFHQVVEKRGGIPSLEQTLNISNSNNDMQDCNQNSRNTFKKNSFHYICYDLSIQDSYMKQKLQKFPIIFASAKEQQDKNNQMEVEKNSQEQEQKIVQNRKTKNPILQIQQKQQSKNSNCEKDRDNNSIQLNSIRKEIDQLSQLSYHIADDEYNNSNSTMNNQQNKKVAKFRIKNQNENQVKVICIQSYSKKFEENSHSHKSDLNSSNLKKRKISLLLKDNQPNQNQNNQNQRIEYNFIDIEPQKKRKVQSSQTDEGDQKNSQNRQKQSSIQVESDQKQINIKMNNLHINQQNSQQQQKQQNSNYRELDKKDFQGNTSSTASTFNKTMKKIGPDNNKNGQNNSSSSSVSSKNKEARQINFQYNHNRKKVIIATQSSSSDSQNVNGSYSVMLSHSKQLNNSSMIDQECLQQNDRSLHNSHQNKMEVEFLYEKLSQDSNERKKKNIQFKEANNLDSMYNGYESDFSQQNEDNESQVDKDAAQNKQIGKKFKLEQYLKGYENDDEFDYNVEDEDEDFSFDQSQKIKRQDFFRRRRFSLSNSAFQSQSSLIKKPFKGSLNNSSSNNNNKCIQLVESQEGKNLKDKQNKNKLKQNLLKTQIRSYISCNEERSNPVESC